MSKKSAPNDIRKDRGLPEIKWIPVNDQATQDPLRDKEIHNLVAQIVYLGKKRGRPSKKEEVDQYAA